MNTGTKKKYYSPFFTIIKVDKSINLNMVSASEEEPPGQPGDDMFSVGGQDGKQIKKELDKNSFEENPFK